LNYLKVLFIFKIKTKNIMSENKNLVREILIRMNSGKFDLDQFYESIERETGGKLTFTNFKNFLDKQYENISKRISKTKNLSYKLYLYFYFH